MLHVDKSIGYTSAPEANQEDKRLFTARSFKSPPQSPSQYPSRQQDTPTSRSETSEYSLLTSNEVAEKLKTSLVDGLYISEAASRLAEYGPNQLPHQESEPLWLRFVAQFKETLILLLLGSAVVSFLMGNLEDAISITCAVTFVVTVGFVQEYRSEKSLEALNHLVPNFAAVIRRQPLQNPRAQSVVEEADGIELNTRSDSNGKVQPVRLSATIPASGLVPGDLVIFNTGDRIPADIRITQAVDLAIDESNLTGENEPVTKSVAQLKSLISPRAPFYVSPATGVVGADVRLNEQHNIAFMGTLIRSGHGQGIVIGTGAKTEFGAISASLQEIESPRTPLQLSMDRLGKDLSFMSFAVIGFIMLIGLLRGWTILEMFQIGVSLAVAAIPEGLPIIVTVTLALGVLRMSKRNAIVRRLPSVETLGSVNVVCTDKTGTLTINHMTVTRVWYFGATSPIDVTRKQDIIDLDAAMQTILRIGNIVNHGRLQAGKSCSSVTSIMSSTAGDDPTQTQTRWLGQPTDVALLDLLDSFGEDDVRTRIGTRKFETPFSSERKWMGVVINGSDSSSGSDVAYIKGALEQILSRCDTYITSDGREVVLDNNRRQEAIDAANTMAVQGLRVLGFASGSIRQSSLQSATRSGASTSIPPKISSSKDEEMYQGLAFAGLVGMNDPPRKGVDRSIRRLMAGGVRVIMVTGDSETTAVAIAKQLGMPVMSSSLGHSVLRGDQVDQISENDLIQAVATTTVFARTSPEHKLKIVRAFQARNDVVAMTGDGVNDAPALKKADIGIAMGKTGTDVAKEAADMNLTDDDFSTILNAIEEGKGIFYNIQNFLTFQLSTSAAALSLVLLSTVFGLKNPLNAMQILWINILMDGPPAQSLGVEPVDPSIMLRPPRSKSARVLTPALLRRVLACASTITLGTLATYIHEMADGRVVTKRDTTMTFTCFVLFDMFNALTCRSASKSIVRGQVRIWGNTMFNIAVGSSLLGQAMVVYLPFFQRIFQTEAIGLWDWARLLAVASCVLWVDEAAKFWRSRTMQGTTNGPMRGYSSNV